MTHYEVVLLIGLTTTKFVVKSLLVSKATIILHILIGGRRQITSKHFGAMHSEYVYTIICIC